MYGTLYQAYQTSKSKFNSTQFKLRESVKTLEVRLKNVEAANLSLLEK